MSIARPVLTVSLLLLAPSLALAQGWDEDLDRVQVFLGAMHLDYTVLTGTNGGDQLLNQAAGEIEAGQTATIIFDLESDLRIGRSSQFKLETSNGNVFVGTVSVGQQSG